METIPGYPLKFPQNQVRTPSSIRKRHPFKLTFDRARRELYEELRRLKVDRDEIVITSNIPLRMDGEPKAGEWKLDDSGVAVYFRLQKRQNVIAIDRFDNAVGNLIAIVKTIQAIRGIERWGGGKIMEQAMDGFRMLPFASARHHWSEVLGIKDLGITVRDVEKRFLELSKEWHPDKNPGDAEAAEKMAAINNAWEEFKKEKGL